MSTSMLPQSPSRNESAFFSLRRWLLPASLSAERLAPGAIFGETTDGHADRPMERSISGSYCGQRTGTSPSLTSADGLSGNISQEAIRRRSTPARTLRLWTAQYRSARELYGIRYFGFSPKTDKRGNRNKPTA